MTDLSLFLKAVGIGVAVAAPIGPMGILCMRTTLIRGWRHGLAIGGGIAIGDGIYGAVAALGMAGLSAFMLTYSKPLHIAAGLFLIWLGLMALRASRNAEPDAAKIAAHGWRRDLATSVLLTLTNPPTIIMFAAVFTALAPSDGFHPGDTLTIVAGVVTGSLLWWGFLVLMVSALRHAIGAGARRWIDRVAGIVLSALGVVEVRRGLAG